MDKILNSLDNMFGFIFKEPLDVTFKRLYVIQVLGVVVSFYLLFDLINLYKMNLNILSDNSVNTIFAFCATIFGTTWLSLNSIATMYKASPKE